MICRGLPISWQLCSTFHVRVRGLTGSSIVKKWMCIVCGLIYDESEGWPDDGIAAGTRWEDVPDDWACPECGVGKEDFEMIETN